MIVSIHVRLNIIKMGVNIKTKKCIKRNCHAYLKFLPILKFIAG